MPPIPEVVLAMKPGEISFVLTSRRRLFLSHGFRSPPGSPRLKDLSKSPQKYLFNFKASKEVGQAMNH